MSYAGRRHAIRYASFLTAMKRSCQELSPDPTRSPKSRRISTPSMDAAKRLKLEPNEHSLRRLLNHASQHIDKTKEFPEPTVLRWAGGWVRDKLLGRRSNDIDVAINNMTGEVFMERLLAIVREECAKPRDERPDFLQGQAPVRKVFSVAKNPEKSKHLETTSCEIWGLDVDFVNLRKETYSQDSRNPQMEFGTAEEDAERRDATINSLFYNITDGTLEDFTGGEEDLKRGIIRTPLEPLRTFTDDPLRVLRLIRFASRLKFDIDEHTQRHMNDPSVLEALRIKISRDRVGQEYTKMMKDAHPDMALDWINKLQLYHTIFTIPDMAEPPQPDLSPWRDAYDCLKYLIESKQPGSLGDRLITDENVFLAWNLAAMIPWTRVPKPDALSKLKKSLIAHVAYEGARVPNKTQVVLSAANEVLDEILELKRATVAGELHTTDKGVVGLEIIRWQQQSQGQWQLCVLNALLVEAMESTSHCGTDDQFLKQWKQFVDHLEGLNVRDFLDLKPLVTGDILKKALGQKPGKWMVPALRICLQWQLRNPGVQDTAGAVAMVLEQRDELGIPR